MVYCIQKGVAGYDFQIILIFQMHFTGANLRPLLLKRKISLSSHEGFLTKAMHPRGGGGGVTTYT